MWTPKQNWTINKCLTVTCFLFLFVLLLFLRRFWRQQSWHISTVNAFIFFSASCWLPLALRKTKRWRRTSKEIGEWAILQAFLPYSRLLKYSINLLHTQHLLRLIFWEIGLSLSVQTLHFIHVQVFNSEKNASTLLS